MKPQNVSHNEETATYTGRRSIQCLLPPTKISKWLSKQWGLITSNDLSSNDDKFFCIIGHNGESTIINTFSSIITTTVSFQVRCQ